MQKFWKKLPGLGITGYLLLGAGLPAIAQSERWPTEVEQQQLQQIMRQRLPDLATSEFYPDRRTLAERWIVAEFARAWAAVDPAVAPYLGEWVAIEESLYIYPSSTPGQVCILDIYLDEGDFYTGQVREGKVYTTTNLVFLLDGNFLGNTFIYEDQPGIYEYAYPRPLLDPATTLGAYYPAAIAAFEAMNCEIGLPNRL
ncbi:hypothetical protein [Leptolyngbya iicbica]|uniref:Uncharacterized protein n=2 Tax=Cyanophyceae TaxID=3028117 RepID=A0A4Q7EEY2_9CYAN|nr:hypothetical protein [Leptolyngbya sp. LK]RZM82404.1 hypothetical protein DYY88_03940 [Leptolyngbya sp. LK]